MSLGHAAFRTMGVMSVAVLQCVPEWNRMERFSLKHDLHLVFGGVGRKAVLAA
jgi:hypothetical protein